uniref:TRP C-terminal domain-containing protein n=1 Tax=Amphimedon queenslandica TaxID=400682 RepID=A0A1X7TUT3_AMPQE
MLRIFLLVPVLINCALGQTVATCQVGRCQELGFGPCAEGDECNRCCEQCYSNVNTLHALSCSVHEINGNNSLKTSIYRAYSLGYRNNKLSDYWEQQLDPSTPMNLNETTESTNDLELVYGYCKLCKAVSFEQKLSKPYTVIVSHNVTTNPCRENGNGYFCSRCKDGFHHNRKGECSTCTHVSVDWLTFLLIELTPITVIFALLFITGFNIITGGLNSAIFFAQMITTTMDITGDGFIPISNITNDTKVSEDLFAAYHFLYDIWNLEFFSPFSLKLCLFRADSFLVYLFVEYLVGFYPIFLLATVTLARLIYHGAIKDKCKVKIDISIGNKINMKWRESTHNLVISVLVLSYAKLASTSAMLISGTGLYAVHTNEYIRTVSLFDPNVTYTSFPYMLFVLVAVGILVLQFFYPFIVLIVKYLREYKRSRKFPFLDKLMVPFLEMKNEFQQSREGNEAVDYIIRFDDHHWIEAVYLILRVCLFVIYVTPLSFIQKFIVEQGFLLVGMMFIVFVQPYKKKWMNRIDMFILLLLVFINTLSIYQYSLAQGSLPLAVSSFVIQYIMIFFPILWMITYVIFLFIIWLISFNCWPTMKARPMLGNIQRLEEYGQSEPSNTEVVAQEYETFEPVYDSIADQ